MDTPEIDVLAFIVYSSSVSTEVVGSSFMRVVLKAGPTHFRSKVGMVDLVVTAKHRKTPMVRFPAIWECMVMGPTCLEE